MSPKRERGLVKNAQQQLPQRVRSFLDFVEQQDRELQLLGVPLVQRFLGEQRMRLAMSEVSRRRADQLGDLVRVLKFGAVDLDARLGIAEQRLGHRLHDARLARSGRPQKQQVADRAAGRIQPGEKHLINFGDFFDGRVLANDLAPESGFEILRRVAAPRWIQCCIESGFHYVSTYRLGSLTGTKGLRVAFMRWSAIAQSCFICSCPEPPTSAFLTGTYDAHREQEVSLLMSNGSSAWLSLSFQTLALSAG